VLVNAAIADEFLPRMAERMAERGVEVRAAGRALELLQENGRENGHGATVKPAGPEDFGTEFLGMVLSVKVVGSLGEAVDHIHSYSFDHTDAILTNDWDNAQRFVNEVNSAVVFVNASTRFNDGAQFGLGAEVAISTQKLHARGPMGLDALTTYKWVGLGDWQVRP
jgi:glutamate-5-semialdehyde dehydrogenase